jgi:hypothetical protein
VLTLELVIILVEAFIYSKFLNIKFLEALAISFILNLISVVVSYMIFSFISVLFIARYHQPELPRSESVSPF